MTDRITSDAVTSERARVVRSGGGLAVRLPTDTAPDTDVRLVFDGRDHYARTSNARDGPVVRAAFDTAADRRTVVDGADGPVPAGDVPNRLREWLAAADCTAGDPVVVDVLDPGRRYGLRQPGDRTVYDLQDRPDDSLRDIADRLGD